MSRWGCWVAAVLVVATAGCGVTGNKAGGDNPAEPVVLSLAHALDAAPLRPFVDQVERRSHGRVRVEPRGVPRTASGDDDATVVDTVRAGHADLGVVPTVLAPLAVDSLAAQERMLNGGARLPVPAGLHRIGALPGPLIRPAGAKSPLLGPRSYRGVRVAVRPSARKHPVFAALHATPVSHNLSGEELLTADGIAAPLADIASNVYDGEVTTLTTNVVLGAQPLVIFARTTDELAVLEAAANAAMPASLELRRAEEDAAVSTVCRRGRVDFVTAGPEDLAELRQALQLQRSEPAPPPEIPTCAGVADETTSTLLDGVYEVTIEQGTRRVTLAHGRFDDAGAHGSYAVHGDVLVLTYAARPDTIAYRWILYDGELTLYPVEGRNSPETLRAKPWRRLGDAPLALRTPADGVYELATASGEFRWTLDRGQLHEEWNGGATWARANYVITGDVLTATYTEIGGKPLTDGPVRPGETAYFRWNLYRGSLRLSPVDDANSPAIFCAAWRRVGDAS